MATKLFFGAMHRCAALRRAAAGLLRAMVLRARGARVGAKARIGRGVRVDRPWAVELGPRCEIEEHVWLKVVDDRAAVRVGASSFLGRGVEIDASERVEIGAHVLLAPGVFITDHAHKTDAGQRIDAQGCTSSPVVIEDDVWLGARAVVLPGVRIGRGAVVGAGAVVTRDIPPETIAAGVPARAIGARQTTDAPPVPEQDDAPGGEAGG